MPANKYACRHCGHAKRQHAQSTQCILNPDADLFDRVLLPTRYSPLIKK